MRPFLLPRMRRQVRYPHHEKRHVIRRKTLTQEIGSNQQSRDSIGQK
jgi:hypothetical protein